MSLTKQWCTFTNNIILIIFNNEILIKNKGNQMWQLHHYYGMHLISVFPCHQPPGIRFLIERCTARNFNLCNDLILSQCVLCTENENGWLGVGAGRNRKKQLFCANTMLCLSPRQRSSAYPTQRRRK